MSALTEQRVREIIREEVVAMREEVSAEMLAAPYRDIFSRFRISEQPQGSSDE